MPQFVRPAILSMNLTILDPRVLRPNMHRVDRALLRKVDHKRWYKEDITDIVRTIAIDLAYGAGASEKLTPENAPSPSAPSPAPAPVQAAVPAVPAVPAAKEAVNGMIEPRVYRIANQVDQEIVVDGLTRGDMVQVGSAVLIAADFRDIEPFCSCTRVIFC